MGSERESMRPGAEETHTESEIEIREDTDRVTLGETKRGQR